MYSESLFYKYTPSPKNVSLRRVRNFSRTGTRTPFVAASSLRFSLSFLDRDRSPHAATARILRLSLRQPLLSRQPTGARKRTREHVRSDQRPSKGMQALAQRVARYAERRTIANRVPVSSQRRAHAFPPTKTKFEKKGSRERNASKTSSIRRARAFFARIVSQLFEECGRLAGPNKTAGILPVFFLSHAHQNSRKRSARLPRRLDSSSSSSSGRKRRRNRRLVKKKGGR